ncbi:MULTISPECIES: hypothetical protein [unclassified Bacillus (in: firmicutes)]
MEIGIPNSTYFIAFFKKKTGLTPTDYRKKQFMKKLVT